MKQAVRLSVESALFLRRPGGRHGDARGGKAGEPRYSQNQPARQLAKSQCCERGKTRRKKDKASRLAGRAERRHVPVGRAAISERGGDSEVCGRVCDGCGDPRREVRTCRGGVVRIWAVQWQRSLNAPGGASSTEHSGQRRTRSRCSPPPTTVRLSLAASRCMAAWLGACGAPAH